MKIFSDAKNPDLEEQMNAEDEYLAELIKRDNEISYFKQKLEKTSEELEKEMILRKEKDKALGEKEKMIIDLAKMLKENNVSIERIIEKTKLSKNEIDNL